MVHKTYMIPVCVTFIKREIDTKGVKLEKYINTNHDKHSRMVPGDSARSGGSVLKDYGS